MGDALRKTVAPASRRTLTPSGRRAAGIHPRARGGVWRRGPGRPRKAEARAAEELLPPGWALPDEATSAGFDPANMVDPGFDELDCDVPMLVRVVGGGGWRVRGEGCDE